MFKTGNKIEITTPGHFYTHMGFVDRNYWIAETVEVCTVTRVIRGKKNGLIVWFKKPDGTGFGINDVENTTRFKFRKIEESEHV